MSRWRELVKIGRVEGRLQRVAIVAFAAAITAIMGVRAPSGRAVSFEGIELQGMGRSTLTIEQTAPAPAEGTTVAMEVFARMIYASELSQFRRGLYMRSTFTIPSTRETGVLVVDVDRANGAKEWRAGAAGLKTRFYTLAGKDARGARFDGTLKSGEVELTASVVGAKQAGFRIGGSLEFVGPGDDGISGNADDEAFAIDLELESVPAPEEITGQTPPPPSTPTGGICDPNWCWQDDGYYDGYWYGPGCGDAEVGYETTDSGCDSDSVDDDSVIDDGGGGGGDGGTYDPYEPGDTSGEAGCDGSSSSDDDSSSSSGCEGSDDSTGSSDGCDSDSSSSSGSGCSDSGSSGSGCSDSGGGSGCSDSGGGGGCSGCEGDTLQRAPARGESNPLKGGLGWIAIVMFVGSLGAMVRRGRDD